jgi:hypothetical protein
MRDERFYKISYRRDRRAARRRPKGICACCTKGDHRGLRRMRKVGRTVLMASLLGVLVCNPSVAQPHDWETYSNVRYGFNFQYPKDIFSIERTAEAGDGHVFVAKTGGARLLVGTLTNGSRFSPVNYQGYIARNSYLDYRVEYRPVGRTWFALSGEGNGKTFYEKVIFSCAGRFINSFAMIYPTNQRHVFDPIVERIENTFRPGRKC